MSEAKLTISRPRGGHDDYILLSVEDSDSGVRFLDLEISLSGFSEALTGLAMVPAKIKTRGLDKVGKKVTRDTLEFKMPDGSGFRDKDKAKEEAERICPEGWECSMYFSSQDSFFTKDGHQYARCTILRWDDKE